MSLKHFILSKGIWLRFSTGKPKDPADIERTDGLRDIAEKKQKEAERGNLPKRL